MLILTRYVISAGLILYKKINYISNTFLNCGKALRGGFELGLIYSYKLRFFNLCNQRFFQPVFANLLKFYF